MTGISSAFPDEKHEATPYHENTKVGRHERRRGYIERQALFRAFQISCFRDWFGLPDSSTFLCLQLISAFEHLNFGTCFEFRASNFGFDGTSELVAVRCVMFFQKVADVYILEILTCT